MADWQSWMRQANHVGGDWIAADSGETIDVANPATGEVIGTVPASGEAETGRAIAAAAAAFPELAGMDLMTRVGLLWKLHDALMDNQAALAEL
jgi:succinate-semialdehyde dehydrogenase/glutarate-semialdehyde dehydrogenase